MVDDNIEKKETKKVAKPKAPADAKQAPAASQKAPAQKLAAAKPETVKPAPKAEPKPAAAQKPTAAKLATVKPAPKAEPKPAAKPAPKAAEPKKTAYQELRELKPEVPAEKSEPQKQPAAEVAKPAPKADETEQKAKARKVKADGGSKKADGKVEIVEDDEAEDEYKPKAKPELSAEKLAALRLRRSMNSKRVEFHRQEWFRYQKLGDKWRKPKGIHSKMRRHYNYRPPVVSIGYRSPRETRGLHPSGFREVVVRNQKDLDFIDPKVEAARVAHGVGFAKLMRIVAIADLKGIRLLNVSSEKQDLARKKAKEEGVKLPDKKEAVE